MTAFVYEEYADALCAAQYARDQFELFLAPADLIIITEGAAIHAGWVLEFDKEAADAHARKHGLILSVCMECGKTLQEKDPEGARAGVSHGYCTRCVERARREMHEELTAKANERKSAT